MYRSIGDMRPVTFDQDIAMEEPGPGPINFDPEGFDEVVDAEVIEEQGDLVDAFPVSEGEEIVMVQKKSAMVPLLLVAGAALALWMWKKG